MTESESIVLNRDVTAIIIPDGTPVTLLDGDVVTIQQTQGGNYTVLTERGYLARIASADADALGKEPEVIKKLLDGSDAQSLENNVWEVLKTVYDPEIPVNIVELGLVYHCSVSPVETDEPLEVCQNDVSVIMTLTAPGCGMGPILQGDVEAGIRRLSGVRNVNVEVVFDPPWSREMMSEVALVQLGMV